MSSSAITDIFYIVKKHVSDTFEAQNMISVLISIITILKVTDKEINAALSLHWHDFEDAVQYSVAKENCVDVIISRNKADYESSEIPVMEPKEFIKMLNNSK